MNLFFLADFFSCRDQAASICDVVFASSSAADREARRFLSAAKASGLLFLSTEFPLDTVVEGVAEDYGMAKTF